MDVLKRIYMNVPLDLRHALCLQPIELQVFRPVALKLVQLLSDPEIVSDTVVEIINEDQALSAQILKMSNSSAFKGLTEMETIKGSVVRLGFGRIANIAMTASMASIHASDNPVVNDVMKELYHHAKSCALCCWWLALNTGHSGIADKAYMAGLLHDIGKLYLLKATERVSQNNETGCVLEKELLRDVFSEMHVELGCRIMDFWNIPSVYRGIVAGHHAEHFDTSDTLLAIVRLVNYYSNNFSDLGAPVQTDGVSLEIKALAIDEATLAKFEAVVIGSNEVDV